jgi:hypothetical protein
MANPRVGYDPLNPLSLHSESRYRNGNYSMASETQNFEAIGAFIKGGAKASGRGILTGGKGIKFIGSKFGNLFGRKAVSSSAKELAEETSKELAEAGAKEGTQQLAGEVTGEGIQAGAKTTLASVGESLSKFPIIRIGAITSMVIVSVGIAFGANEMIEAITDNFTGMNCDGKAKEQGLTEGSDEYKQMVEGCQKAAARNLNFLGIGTILLVGGLSFLLISRYLPKKSSGEPAEE